jgi:chromate transporter
VTPGVVAAFVLTASLKIAAPVVRPAFAGLAAATSAFARTRSFKVAAPPWGAPMWGRLLAMAIMAVTFVAIAVFRMPLPLTMPVLAVVSILMLWRFEA